MNREIKFRAWDKLKHKMIATGFHLIGEITMFQMIENYYFNMREETGKTTLELLNNCVEMQYVGFSDKKGIDIYEGDIVKFKNGRGNPRQAIVEWDDEGGCLPFRDNTYIQDEQGEWFDYKYGFEVIGNVFETPNLLKP